MSLFDDPYGNDDSLEAYKAGKNPPPFGAGQDDDDFLFAPPSSSDSYMGEGSNFNSFTNPSFGSNPFGPQPNQNNQNEKAPLEDRIMEGSWDLLKKGTKGTLSFLEELWGTFKITTPQGWLRTWVQLRTYGMWFSVAGFVTWILGMFLPVIANSTWLLIFGVLTGVIGLAASIMSAEKTKKWIDEEGMQGTTTDDLRPIDGGDSFLGVDEEPTQGFSEDSGYSFEPSSSESNGFSDEWEDEDDGGILSGLEEDGWEEEDGFVGLSSHFEDEPEVLVADEPESVDDAIKELDLAAPGMQSRVYLYEQFFKVLRSVTPNYSTLREVDMDEQIFQDHLNLLMNSAAREGFTEDDFRLEYIYENSFMIKLVVAANNKFKSDKVAESIENQLKYNNLGMEVAPELFVTSKVIGNNVHIDIIKNDSPMLTVKDMWSENKDFILDPENVMPVVLGSDELGQSIVMDFAKINSIALSGKPGKGKTWLAQSILAQLAFFSSPNQVQFIIADPKGSQGDFVNMNFPHVIEKVKTEEETMEVFRRIVREEVPRREALLGQYGLTDIKDLHRLYPDVTMPYLYVIVEEMMSLGDHLKQLDKDSYKEYRAVLSDIVNKCRYLGIRLFGLSQRMTDNAIPRDIKVGIDLKMTAGAEPSEIEQVMEVKPKDFPYKIAGKVGKYAIMSPEYKGSSASFMVGAVLGTSNPENAETYRYVKALWDKLEPIKEVETTETLVAKELSGASSTEMDDILNSDIQLW